MRGRRTGGATFFVAPIAFGRWVFFFFAELSIGMMMDAARKVGDNSAELPEGVSSVRRRQRGAIVGTGAAGE